MPLSDFRDKYRVLVKCQGQFPCGDGYQAFCARENMAAKTIAKVHTDRQISFFTVGAEAHASMHLLC